ncbi:glycosyltransferase family 39 protein [Streptomyces sp. NBC_00133]|uniref:glycosyltransferase family 39 protein n=1 Tax=Streptomyces sp. NBC_00133 TaxID=2903624 RepID=UPI00324B16AD
MALLPRPTTLDRPAPAEDTGPSQTPEAPQESHGVLRSVWLWPVVATLACTVYGIRTPVMWEDELTSWDVASRDLGQLLDTVQRVDAVLGTYYLLLHGWMTVFGDSATSLRLPSALAMAGAAGCAALCGQRLFGRRAGLAGGLLFALIPVVSRYAHEARPYALVVCAVSLSTLLLLRALDRPGSRRRWAAYALGVAAVGLFHLLALTVLLGHMVAVGSRVRAERRVLWGFGIAASVGVIGVVPVALLGRAQTGRQISWIPRPDMWGLVAIWPQLFASATLAGAVIALAVTAWGERRSAALCCTAMAVLPPLVLWVVSHGQVSYFFYRYLLFTLPAWVMLAGAGLVAARSRAVVAAALVVLAVLTVREQQALRKPFAHFSSGLDYPGAALTIEKFYQPGDAVIYDRGDDSWRMLDVGVRFYLPDDLRMHDVFLAESSADRDDLRPTECGDPGACLRGDKRVWLVVSGNWGDPFRELPDDQERALRARYTAYGSAHVTGITVTLLELKA